MNKKTSLHLDLILLYLSKPENNLDKWSNILKVLNIDTKYSDSLLSILKTKNLIIVHGTEGYYPDVQISDKGQAYIQESSFLRDFNQRSTDVKRLNTKLIIASASPVIAIISIVVNIYLFNFKNDCKELNLKLDKENKILKDSLNAIKQKNDSVYNK